MAISDEGMDLPGEQINPGQQTERALAFVLLITREGRVDAGLGRLPIQAWCLLARPPRVLEHRAS